MHLVINNFKTSGTSTRTIKLCYGIKSGSGTTVCCVLPASYTSSTSYAVVTTCYHTNNSNTYERYVQGRGSSYFIFHGYSDSSASVYFITLGY